MLQKVASRKCIPLLIAALASVVASADTVTLGTVNFDLTGLPGTATVDIANQTGPNSSTFPDTTFPVSTAVSFSNLALTLDFSGGSTQSFGASYFTLSPDGLSFDGATISISTAVTAVVLTGDLSPTVFTLNDGSTFNASPSFKATITDPSGTLMDGDFAIIDAVSGTGPPPVIPEPGTWMLLGIGVACLLISRFRRVRGEAIVLSCFFLISPASAAPTSVKLNASASPSSGIAGTSLIWVTGSGFPSGAIDPASVTIEIQTACGTTAGETSAMATAARSIIGTSDKVQFQIPASVATGKYFVSISGSTTGGAAFTSGNCSALSVTHSSTAVGSCNPGSSMGMLVPAAGSGTVTVTAYVPNSDWGGGGVNVQAVPVEGSGSPATVSTANEVNSCSTDSVSGITACTANGFPALVYLITGSSVTKTVTTASDRRAGFSGGSCFNCGVAVNAVTHQAVITMGLTGSPSALQFLNLTNGTLGTPIPTVNIVSEDVLWDPFRNLILSPNEGSGIYDLFQISGTGLPGPSNVVEFGNRVAPGSFLDSAGEDCTTGIALATDEGTGNLFIAELKQATFTPGSPAGSWTASEQLQNFPEFNGLAAGTSAIAVAPGSTHQGIVAGEFGGSTVGVIQLPGTSGSGMPSVVDYAYATLPNTPDHLGFSNGFDPHTTTAYTSPNNGKAYGVAASWATGGPAFLAIIDIQATLSAPRVGAHTVDPAYDLLAHGVVRYVATH